MDFNISQVWAYISGFDWRNLTKDKIENFIEADQFKAVVMVVVAITTLVAYTIFVNLIEWLCFPYNNFNNEDFIEP